MSAVDWYEDQESPGFHPIPSSQNFKICTNIYHSAPGMLYVPPGQKYVHICPGCGQKQVIYPTLIAFS